MAYGSVKITVRLFIRCIIYFRVLAHRLLVSDDDILNYWNSFEYKAKYIIIHRDFNILYALLRCFTLASLQNNLNIFVIYYFNDREFFVNVTYE